MLGFHAPSEAPLSTIDGPVVLSVTPSEFDMDAADVDIAGIGFEASQGTGTVYISPTATKPTNQFLRLYGNGWTETADSAAISIDDSIECRVRLSSDNWTGTGLQTFMSKRAGSDEWQFRSTTSTGGLNFVWWDAGGAFVSQSSSTPHGLPNNVPVWIRFRRVGTSLTFWTSTDDTNDHTAVIWKQLSTHTISSGAAIRDTATHLTIGNRGLAASEIFQGGDIYRAVLIDDATVVFDANFMDQTVWLRGDVDGETGSDGLGNTIELELDAKIIIPGDMDTAITSWSNTAINLDLSALTAEELEDLSEIVGPGDQFVVVETNGVEHTFSDVLVHRIKAFAMSASTHIPGGGAATTAQLAPPDGKTTGDFGGGDINDEFATGNSVNIGADQYREDEWSVIATDVRFNEAYEFRVFPNLVQPEEIYANPQISFFDGGGGAQNITVTGATETETAAAVQAHQAYVVGKASETETANTVQANQAYVVGQATETETAGIVEIQGGGNQSISANKASETETANAVTIDLTAPVGKATETELARAIFAQMVVGLHPDGDGNNADVVDEGDATSDLYASIDDDPSSPNDSDWNNNIDDAGQAFYLLTDMPGDFAEASSATITVRYRGQEFGGFDPVTLYARLYQSDETTALSDEVEVAGAIADSAFTSSSPVTLTGIVAANKAIWDDFRVRLRWERTCGTPGAPAGSDTLGPTTYTTPQTVSNKIFDGNHSDDLVQVHGAHVIFENCTFTGTGTGATGHSLEVKQGGSVEVYNCLFNGSPVEDTIQFGGISGDEHAGHSIIRCCRIESTPGEDHLDFKVSEPGAVVDVIYTNFVTVPPGRTIQNDGSVGVQNIIRCAGLSNILLENTEAGSIVDCQIGELYIYDAIDWLVEGNTITKIGHGTSDMTRLPTGIYYRNNTVTNFEFYGGSCWGTGNSPALTECTSGPPPWYPR